MSPKTKKKLCWHCEGSVSVDNDTCPYCGVNIASVTPSDSLPLKAPYATVGESVTDLPEPPYPSSKKEAEETEEEQHSISQELRHTAFAINMVGIGSILILFGLVLLIFSDPNGILTLHWNGSYWFIYPLIGVPLVYLGWKFFSDEG